MINKQAELYKLALLYVACKGILRVKQAGFVKEAGWWDSTKQWVGNGWNRLKDNYMYSVGEANSMPWWKKALLYGSIGTGVGAAMAASGGLALPAVIGSGLLGGAGGSGLGLLSDYMWGKTDLMTKAKAKYQLNRNINQTPQTATPQLPQQRFMPQQQQMYA